MSEIENRIAVWSMGWLVYCVSRMRTARYPTHGETLSRGAQRDMIVAEIRGLYPPQHFDATLLGCITSGLLVLAGDGYRLTSVGEAALQRFNAFSDVRDAADLEADRRYEERG